MNFFDEHKTQNGTSFYSSWAWAKDENKMYDANLAALKEYDGKFCYPHVGQSVEECITENPDKLVLMHGNTSYGRRSYIVKANPNRLSSAEIALIADEGNLCFGFTPTFSGVEIYTD